MTKEALTRANELTSEIEALSAHATSFDAYKTYEPKENHLKEIMVVECCIDKQAYKKSLNELIARKKKQLEDL